VFAHDTSHLASYASDGVLLLPPDRAEPGSVLARVGTKKRLPGRTKKPTKLARTKAAMP
jgi:hypothetical protein